MFGNIGSVSADLSAEYHEESVRMPVAITVVLLLLISIPLGVWIHRIDAAGKISTNISKYESLVTSVDHDVQIVNAILSSNADELKAINSARSAGKVTLIVPEVVIVEKRSEQPINTSLSEIDIDGIYWSPANPLVTINGETHREGDVVGNYTIVTIGKRSVIFKGRDGSLTEKDIYENLLREK